MPTKTVKLLTNVPLTGILSAVYFAKSKTEGWADQIKLRGQWDEHGEGDVYLSDWLAKGMIERGLLDTDGLDRDGLPAYKVLHHGRIQLLREEIGGKKQTSILPLEPTAAAGAPPPPAVPHGHAPTPASRGPSVPTTASAPPVNDAWTALYEAYERAAQIAIKVWGSEFPADALVRATAAVFIEANKKGLAVRPKLDPAFSEPPPALAGVLAGRPNDGLPW